MSGRRPEWPEVRDHCNKFIEASRRTLEQPGLSGPESDTERGRIAALREVLRLADPAPETPSTDTFDY